MVTKRRKSKLVKFLFLIVICCISSCNSQEQTTTIHNLSLQNLKENVIGKNTQLIDVRTPKEYNTGHIDNAININYYDNDLFLSKVTNLDKYAPINVYCHSGVRSKKACKLLHKLGFQKIYNFSGGWKTWVKYKNKID